MRFTIPPACFAVLLSFLFLPACGGKSSYTINWYLRIDKTEEGDYSLMAGPESILHPLDAANWNGDSLVVRSAEACYFIDMTRAADYHSPADMQTIGCDAFGDYVRVGAHAWPP